MQFVHPAFLVIAAGSLVALGLAFVVTERAGRRALARFGAARLLPRLTASLSPGRRRFKQAALAIGTALVIVAFARPELGYRSEEVHRKGVDLLFAIDTSKSMLTRDLKPNRLERAKLAVRSLADKFPQHRVGLVVFAGRAFLETPLTLDHAIFDESVATLDTGVIPLGGTNLGGAIDAATRALAGDAHDKVLMLLTDGEELSGDALDAARRAAKAGVVIDTIGVGTPSGELVPEPGEDGQSRFVRDADGQLVTSRLDEARLASIARATGGQYRPLGVTGEGLESLYHERLAKLVPAELGSRSVRVPIERFQWPLGAGLLLLAIEPLIGDRRRRSRRPLVNGRAAAAAAVAALLLPHPAWASPQSAERAYAKGDFEKAEREYADAARSSPSDARLTFNRGAAAYRRGAYEEAAKAFESSLRSTDLGLQEQAYYNLGDAGFRLGEAALAKHDVEGAKARWKGAMADYERALKLRAEDADARYNLELVKRRLAELEERSAEPQSASSRSQQPQQSQAASGQKPQNQQGQGQQQPQHGQQGQGQQQPQHGQGQQQPQQGQGQQQPQQGQGENHQGKGQPRDPQEADGAEAQAGRDQAPASGSGAARTAGGERSKPGALSQADAEALLDSMRGELELGVRAPDGEQRTTPHEPQKDW